MAENEVLVEGQQVEEATTMDVTDKKCPNCGATVTYDPNTLSMTCEYCGYHKELPKPEAGKEIEEIDFASAKIRQNQNWGTKKKSIVCKMCGAETLYDEAETASVCPYCGSTSVMPVDDDENVMAPGGVVPFEVDREKAAKLFRTWLSKKFFAKKDAKNCEANDFNGIYLPYWTYDSDTTSSYNAQLGFDYKVQQRGSDGKMHTVTKTRWRNYTGIYEEFIDDQVVYASKKTTNPYIESVSQFDFSKLREYSPEFIAGFAAERYTLGLDDGWNKAKVFIKQTLTSHLSSKLRNQYKADKVGTINLSTSYDNVTFKYILAPVWIASFRYGNDVYNFVVNGQTGKIAGKYPISKLKVFLTILAIVAVIALLIFLSNM